ncbi:MAG: helix-turn-helix transcriptional regulator [Bacteroidota bacterium]
MNDRFLRLEQILPDLVPISRSAWWKGVKSGKFPPSIKLSARTTVWRESDIKKLIQHGTNQNWRDSSQNKE